MRAIVIFLLLVAQVTGLVSGNAVPFDLSFPVRRERFKGARLRLLGRDSAAGIALGRLTD